MFWHLTLLPFCFVPQTLRPFSRSKLSRFVMNRKENRSFEMCVCVFFFLNSKLYGFCIVRVKEKQSHTQILNSLYLVPLFFKPIH